MNATLTTLHKAAVALDMAITVPLGVLNRVFAVNNRTSVGFPGWG